ncbi:MAG: ATP synthase F0 subunit B [Elusimicrobia bacterium CG08_land_8_20_14_0_20_59_10]|nr:MAG: ATP synthase F0 subunit B [Elusimicrobia bacterium CG08_land_8_20_14_0_20_59_10]
MEALIKPELGLTIWTIVCFVLLVLLLSKTAWKPLLQAVAERERAIKNDRESAETARAEAEKVKAELDARLAQLRTEIQARMGEALQTAEREKELLLTEARKSAASIVEFARKEIEAQKLEAVRELKNKVAELSLLTAEKVLMKNLDHRANTELSARYLAQVEKERPDLKMSA